MSKFQMLEDLVHEDSKVFYESHLKAVKYAFQVRANLIEYLEAPHRGSIEITMLDYKIVHKSFELKMERFGRRSNDFRCGLLFHFHSNDYTDTSEAYLEIYVEEEQCKLFGKKLDIKDSQGIGEHTFKSYVDRFKGNNERIPMGFVNNETKRSRGSSITEAVA